MDKILSLYEAHPSAMSWGLMFVCEGVVILGGLPFILSGRKRNKRRK